MQKLLNQINGPGPIEMVEDPTACIYDFEKPGEHCRECGYSTILEKEEVFRRKRPLKDYEVKKESFVSIKCELSGEEIFYIKPEESE